MSGTPTGSPLALDLQSVLSSGQFLDEVNAGLVLQGVDGRAIDCNKWALGLLGITRNEMLGRSPFGDPWEAVREDCSPYPEDEHPGNVTLKSLEPSTAVVMGVDVPGRARLWILVHAAPYVVAGTLRGTVTEFSDYSAQWQERTALRLITKVNRLVMFATSEATCLQQLCEALVNEGKYSLAWIGLDSGGVPGEITVASAAGRSAFLEEGMFSALASEDTGIGPTGTALREMSTQVANDLATQPRYGPWRQRAAMFGFNSSIAIPMQIGGRKAVLSIYDQHAYSFDEMTATGLEEVAREVEFGAAHFRSVELRELALDGTIAALSRMTETRDPYTAGHQLHVGELGGAIARRLGLDDEQVDLIRKSGELHDIGKISIPAEILVYPGKLSDLEFEMVKRHTLVGADILSRASLPWPMTEVALQHHERMDGSGYPAGLLGSEIVLPARVIAVADVIEAMAHMRPYRPALGVDAALAEVRDHSGTLFDAEVVAACQEVFDDGFEFRDESQPVLK
jgi:putative nucleotidyltransferase with HDIG domain